VNLWECFTGVMTPVYHILTGTAARTAAGTHPL
jgi:hypothetical protein